MRPATRSPRTNIRWSDLASWLEGAHAIEKRRSSRHRYAAMDRHWAALTVETVRGAQRAWAKPVRGHRANTRWELFNVEARNRLFRIERSEDLATLGLGHNALNNAPDAQT
jgi:hypothetical protein